MPLVAPGGVVESRGHAETFVPGSEARGGGVGGGPAEGILGARSRMVPERGVAWVKGTLRCWVQRLARPDRAARARGQVWPRGCGSRVMVPGDLVRDAPSPVYRRRLERCLDRKRDDLRPVHVVHSCRLLLGGKGLGRELFRTRGMPAQPPPPASRCPTWWLARVL